MAGTAALGLVLTACGSEDSEPEATDNESSSESTDSAAPADDEFTNDECPNGSTSDDSFKAGGILPLTGNLAFLGPPEVAGVGMAVSDINAAGGVNGADACHQIEDSGDTTDLSISTASARKLIQDKASVVIGAASSSVSLNFVDRLTAAKITQVSPANTAVDLSGYSDFYFRTAPPDGIQGNALGSLISSDGFQKVAFIVFSDTYGTGLRDVVQETIEAGGGECTYGCKGDGDEFPAGQTTFSSEVSAATNSNPDAIVILAFDETKAIVPELASTGWDMSATYFSDGNTADFSEDFEAGTLTGAQGTIPGADAAQDFKDRLVAWNEYAFNDGLTDFAYAAESYDATILAALAAYKGGATDSVTVQKNFAAVSGATGGEECTSYADCTAMLDEGNEIRYVGPSGIGPIDEENDPSSAFVGIYTYNENNKNELTTTVEGQKQS
ncbi:Leucine-, isoleucine-, valine-, threonine-, and alanine-binding protein precursor [Nocardioides dokdonensis FR1436]|uniref:Leucine-, isoleucine-, valine-, threonine-, and alanine-binding protein n=1 Tax=Nocardioides dokdonensis FR1436 TaxID=1300347 RepID=A0A1A9GP21_9ACTN|nr:ABC transporter substrate-binding protein [Nocardioides dokdonensis]ANH40077.1 Leucine-, isoleucine-, valine-, threonine-, and alanine-binding protein precursor [Nocardioides dokdonensis FR1436]